MTREEDKGREESTLAWSSGEVCNGAALVRAIRRRLGVQVHFILIWCDLHQSICTVRLAAELGNKSLLRVDFGLLPAFYLRCFPLARVQDESARHTNSTLEDIGPRPLARRIRATFWSDGLAAETLGVLIDPEQ